MTTTMPTRSAHGTAATLLNKVPEVTLWFWIIKVLSTTVGETFADYLNETLGFGLQKTTLVMSVAFVAALAAQFTAKRYVAPLYWLTVVLISVVGTLVTDNLTDGMGVPLLVTTPIFTVALAICFFLWWRSEGTLSIHSIFTRRREAWYWLAILFTFALGTAAGDLIAEQFALGYVTSLLLFAGVIAAIVVAYFVLDVDAVLAFWAAYVMTRPLGASIGDLMSQAKQDGGLGLGTTATSFVFLAAILAVVTYLTLSRADVQEKYVAEHGGEHAGDHPDHHPPHHPHAREGRAGGTSSPRTHAPK